MDATSLTKTSTETMLRTTDANNVTVGQGWWRESDGTWSAMTTVASSPRFRRESGARNWFIRHVSQRTLVKMGLA